MKTPAQAADTTKAKIAQSAKTTARRVKSKTKAKRSAAKTASRDLEGAWAGYSKHAQDFLDRSKIALHAASDWAGSTARHLPEAARKLNLPDQKAAMDFAESRPLVVGAVGLGLGLVVGALLPRMTHSTAAPKKRR